jgi:ribose transport system ATP-binding protein
MPKSVQEGLFFDNIVKSFGGTLALRGVSLHVARGEILALLGENGAGKSTLIKVLGGIHEPNSGRVSIDGINYTHSPSRLNERQAVAFIHQDLGLVEWMTVAENMALAQGYARKFGLINWKKAEDIAERALNKVDCDFDPTTRVSDLSRTEKSLVAIARALAVECDFLVLDEPTASLPADEVERLFNALRPLKEAGVGMIYVSHRLDEVFKIADRVAVLRDGMLVGMRDIAHTNSPELVNLIVGRKTRDIDRPDVDLGSPVIQTKNLRLGIAGPLDMKVNQGEIVGLVGLRVAGHEEIGRSFYGASVYTGDILLNGQKPDLSSPRAAMKSGVGLVARDRVVESIARWVLCHKRHICFRSSDHRLLCICDHNLDLACVGIYPDWPISLCNWRKSKSCRIKRYSNAKICCWCIHHLWRYDSIGGRHFSFQTSHWSGQCWLGISPACPCWRILRINYNQAWPRQCVGNHYWCVHSRRWHFRNPTIWWLILG